MSAEVLKVQKRYPFDCYFQTRNEKKAIKCFSFVLSSIRNGLSVFLKKYQTEGHLGGSV